MVPEALTVLRERLVVRQDRPPFPARHMLGGMERETGRGGADRERNRPVAGVHDNRLLLLGGGQCNGVPAQRYRNEELRCRDPPAHEPRGHVHIREHQL